MTEDTYTHRPGQVEEDRGGRESDGNSEEFADRDLDPETDPRAPVERGHESFNYRDWVLVGLVVVCFLVIPATILYLPPIRPFRFAYLVLPMIPALVLGAVAVWSAQRSE